MHVELFVFLTLWLYYFQLWFLSLIKSFILNTGDAFDDLSSCSIQEISDFWKVNTEL